MGLVLTDKIPSRPSRLGAPDRCGGLRGPDRLGVAKAASWAIPSLVSFASGAASSVTARPLRGSRPVGPPGGPGLYDHTAASLRALARVTSSAQSSASPAHMSRRTTAA